MQINKFTKQAAKPLPRISKAARSLALFVIAVTLLSSAAFAEARELVAAGCTVGIRMELGGLMVVGLTPVKTEQGDSCPAQDAGVMLSDLIIKLDDTETKNVEQFIGAATQLDGSTVRLTVKRGEQTLELSLVPAMSLSGCWEMGLMLREGISGIGTVTFYDPKTGLYGALGHPINDVTTGAMMPLGDGRVSENTVSEVRAGTAGTPGEIIGSLDGGKTIGSILLNSDRGIFGRMESGGFTSLEPVPVGGEGTVQLGPAKVRANVQGSEVREYDIEISRVYRGDVSGRCMMIKVTDPELISITGGIVQGMSGSPILQNGMLVGAVTHVLVGDPTRGYAIFIDRMLEYSDAMEAEKNAA